MTVLSACLVRAGGRALARPHAASWHRRQRVSGDMRVGDMRVGDGHGAAITLIEDDEHIRFDIDTQEAARCGLRFSSRLLRLARNVL